MEPCESESPLRVHFIGQYGVGKRSLAYALGALPFISPSIEEEEEDMILRGEEQEDFELYLNGDQTSMDLHIYHTIQDFTSPQDNGMDLFVLIFDLTNVESMEMVLSQYKKLHNAKPKVFLVGTKNDLDDLTRRQMFALHAEILANEIEFEQYFELSSTEPPFHGLGEFLHALKKWKTSCTNPVIVKAQVSKSSDHQPAKRPTIRTKTLKSIWLYDNAADPIQKKREEEMEEKDRDLRSISRILCEIRTTGPENMKKQMVKRDLNTQRLLSKVQYHGPTESSIHMRWKHQEDKNNTRQKIASTTTSSRRSSSTSTNNFMRQTELSRLRLLEKTNSNNSQNKIKKTRPFATTSSSAGTFPSANTATATATTTKSPSKLRAKTVALVVSRLGISRNKTNVNSNITTTTTTTTTSSRKSLTLSGIDQYDAKKTEEEEEEWSPPPPPLELVSSSPSPSPISSRNTPLLLLFGQPLPPPPPVLSVSSSPPPSPLFKNFPMLIDKKEPANIIDDELPKSMEAIREYFEGIAFQVN